MWERLISVRSAFESTCKIAHFFVYSNGSLEFPGRDRFSCEREKGRDSIECASPPRSLSLSEVCWIGAFIIAIPPADAARALEYKIQVRRVRIVILSQVHGKTYGSFCVTCPSTWSWKRLWKMVNGLYETRGWSTTLIVTVVSGWFLCSVLM